MNREKPTVKLLGQDGNVFSLIGICTKALRRDGNLDQAKELTNRCFNAKSYEEAIQIIGEYCEIN